MLTICNTCRFIVFVAPSTLSNRSMLRGRAATTECRTAAAIPLRGRHLHYRHTAVPLLVKCQLVL